MANDLVILIEKKKKKKEASIILDSKHFKNCICLVSLFFQPCFG